MRDLAIEHYVSEFLRGHEVPSSETAVLFDAIVGTDDKQALVSLLRAWNEKGFTESELFNFASLMRNRMVRIKSSHSPLVDIVGTGAAAAKTFNVSTAAAIIVAGTGIAVAKHGNRAATSLSGSADVLTQLGIKMEAAPAVLEQQLEQDGICFLFAPNHHALSATLGQARRELGGPTIFNCLGPLCNPAMPTHSIIGVSRREWLTPMANTLSRLGTVRSWVVNGERGLDEVDLGGSTMVAEIHEGDVRTFEVDATSFGMPDGSANLPTGCDAAESAAFIESILGGTSANSDVERLAVMNASAALYLTGAAESLAQAADIATESIRSGSARMKLNALRRSSES